MGGMMMKLGSPPGNPLGMPAAPWLAVTLPSMMGLSLSTQKSELVDSSRQLPRSSRRNSLRSPPRLVRTVAPKPSTAITRNTSGSASGVSGAPALARARWRLKLTGAMKRCPAERIGSSCSSRWSAQQRRLAMLEKRGASLASLPLKTATG
jgi:hypothetical protein